jgi:hypothetical protein
MLEINRRDFVKLGDFLEQYLSRGAGAGIC